jgi:hypothetical protein
VFAAVGKDAIAAASLFSLILTYQGRYTVNDNKIILQERAAETATKASKKKKGGKRLSPRKL